MANPTFNSTPLTTDAPRVNIGQPAVRAVFSTLPGTDGAYVQGFGNGARPITVTGIYTAGGETAQAALTALSAAMRTLQGKADGSTVASFVGTDGATYATCILTSFSYGQIVIDAGAVEAVTRIHATLSHLAPASVTGP